MENDTPRMCNRCVMDTTDPDITFDQAGICNHCRTFDAVTSRQWFPNEEGMRKLEAIVGRIKAAGAGKEYDCVLGLSGGVDSSYLALMIKDYGLRPLVVHVDAGWNSELAVFNIEKIVKACGYDLHTHVMEWDEVRDLQLAYLRAGIANQDVVQDHAYFASLYRFAAQNRIKYVISGANIATESVFPKAWHHPAMDAINLRSIHKRYGRLKLRQYKTISFFAYHFYYPYVRGMTVVYPLNLMPYLKADALRVLREKVGYREYGRKHGESRFTKFFQNHYLPVKFGIDKRKPHLSSQILSGELTREEALAELRKPLYEPSALAQDKEYVAKKLGLSVGELNSFVSPPGRKYSEFRNWDRRYRFMKLARAIVERITGSKVKTYS